MKAVLRASRIGRVILRYRLDDLLQGTPAERWLRLAKPFVPRASADIAAQSRGARLRLALQDLGPIFVKFGQILSTRRDLVPPDVANELTLLQDRVKPFDGETARRIVEEALGLPVSEALPPLPFPHRLRQLRYRTAGLGLDRAGARSHAGRWPPGGGQGAAPGHREADRRRYRVAQFAGCPGRAHPPAR